MIFKLVNFTKEFLIAVHDKVILFDLHQILQPKIRNQEKQNQTSTRVHNVKSNHLAVSLKHKQVPFVCSGMFSTESPFRLLMLDPECTLLKNCHVSSEIHY